MRKPSTQWVVIAECEHIASAKWTFGDHESAEAKIQALEAGGWRGWLYELAPLAVMSFGDPPPREEPGDE